MPQRIGFAALLLAASAAAAGLPEVPAPNFVSAAAVEDSVAAMVDRLKSATKGDDRTWQALRAQAMCETVRIELRQAEHSGSYSAATAERRWRECAEAYARVP
jgi:hypothetical protein